MVDFRAEHPGPPSGREMASAAGDAYRKLPEDQKKVCGTSIIVLL
jgi:hypothetical protein